MKKAVYIVLLVSLTSNVFAQARKKKQQPKKEVKAETKATRADTVLPTRTVIVTSAFQPSLKTTAKINFSGASPLPDSVRPVLQYNVPAQNLSFTYQSPALKPLAQNIDTSVHWENAGYLKAGYGNFTSPLLQAGVSLGDGVKSAINLRGYYTSSKSAVNEFQRFSKAGAEGIGIFSSPNNKNEWTGRVFFDNNTQYQYGFQPDTLKFSKDDLRQSFSTLGGSVALRNKTTNDAGINYNPAVSLNMFGDNHGARESNFVIKAPISKDFGENFSFNIGLTADITSYKSDTSSIDNTLYYLTPSVTYKTENFKAIAGITPSWDNNEFAMLPNIGVEFKLSEKKFIAQAGYTGYFNKTSYQYLASVNPWLQQPKFLLNTKMNELYAGFKGSVGSHLTYNAKVSYIEFANQPLFVNDTITGRSFEVLNESAMKAIRLHGELGYTVQEKFSLLAGATINRYSGLEDNIKPWGLVPMEINASLRWQIFKDFTLKSDLFFWDGANYRFKDLSYGKLDPALDLNAGVEFKVLPQLKGWVQINNIFNNQYERWKQYPVLGFNVMAGVIWSFGDIKTVMAK
ncbi:BamA/TamA family outer membrane protein [Panacibacter sp. DH6]|uniref:BamA/TamA family outer membrane protein n=1 Tax=Panacibacter microcysteis TaxID=2793269 RepID=A0A931E7C4_9BACT|nr:BamA/TamA family outer membrane protein [Panacibacter microcysteis]MBG9376761.1 BamA/TamA family outer membrane protein [Panacibacter microcysteis]